MELRRRGDYQGAKRSFQELLDQDPENTAALEGMTLTAISLGQFPEALGYVELWEKIKPSPYTSSLKGQIKDRLQPSGPAPSVSTPTASYSAGMDLRKAGDNAGAKRIFLQLLEQDPKSGGALEGLTITSMSLDQYEEALGYIERWEKLGDSAYIQAFKTRVLNRLHPPPPPPALSTQAPSAQQPPSYYSIGMDQRKQGDPKGAQETFKKLLAQDPQSGGALEGLTLTSLSLGRNEDAVGYAERWEKQGDSNYIQTMKARALAKLGRRSEQAASLVRAIELDPTDVRSGRRLDDLLRADARGVMTHGALSKSLSQEGLGTRSVNQIVYESRSVGALERVPLRRGLNATLGQSVSESAQRNGTRNFTYFDVLEQIYSVGLEARGKTVWGSAEYGQSLLSDVKSTGVGRQRFSRVKVNGTMIIGDLELRAFGERAPYFLRGTGGNQFFALLREDSAKLEAEVPFLGLTWLARGGVTDYSDHVTVNSESLAATLEGGSYYLSGSIGHTYQEYFGAGPTGKLTIMPYDRQSVRGRYGTDGEWLASASYGHSAYRDANRENDGSADLKLWLPWWKEKLGHFWGSYRFSIEEYLVIADGYQSSDKRSHWAGLFWKRQWGKGPWLQLGYERGFLDDSRGEFEGVIWSGEIEWYRRRAFSLTGLARYATTTTRDESASGGFKARWTF